jgi:glycosyltransferase involved in cell wall biosynthesis
MKVVVFVEYFPPELGSDRRIFEIMRRLSQKHEIHFIVLPSMRGLLDRTRNTEGKEEPRLRKGITVKKYAGITGHFIPIPSGVVATFQHSFLTSYLVTTMWILSKTAGILKQVKADTIVLNYPSPYTGLLGFIAGKLWRKPVVLDFNDLIAQYTITLFNIPKNSAKASLLIFIQRHIARNSRKVIVPTQFIRNYAVSLGVPEKNIKVISNGVDVKEFNPYRYRDGDMKNKLVIEKRKICLYCGRLDTWAGIEIISKLCDMARSRRLNVEFVLAGKGAEGDFHKENAVLLGEVPYEKIPQLLAAAEVVLIPFPNNEVSHAASPLKLFEAMAMRKTVIASRVSGVEQVIADGENGFLVDPDNVREWAEKLEFVLRSEATVMKIGDRARRTVEEKFDWAHLAEQFGEVLNAAVSRY